MKTFLKILLTVVILLVVTAVAVVIYTLTVKRTLPMNRSRTKTESALASQLKSHVYKLSHEIGERNFTLLPKLEKAADYIITQFESLGYKPVIESYEADGKTFKNLIFDKKGTVSEKDILIIGAHYDTANTPGADDNASAVAGLIEIARSASITDPKRTIRFIAFTNEEPPFFRTKNMGSRVYARNARERGEKIRGAIVLEMIGYYSKEKKSQKYPPVFRYFYPSVGDFIAVVGNFGSRRLVKDVVRSFRKASSFPIESTVTFSFIPGIDFSDHASFWKEGYPAVMITDTSFYRNPNYHESTDTYETLDYESMAEVVRGLAKAVEELANKP